MNMLIGPFQSDQVTLIISDNNQHFPSSLQKKIDCNWDELVKSGKNIWNSQLYRLAHYNINDNTKAITLHLSLTDYKTTLATRTLKNDFLGMKFTDRPNGMYVATILQTSDDFSLFGKKDSQSIQKNNINLIGGVLSKDESTISTFADIEKHALKEIEEELGLDPSYIQKLSPLGIVETESLRIAICFKAEIALSKVAVEKLLIVNDEHSEILFVQASQISTFIEKHVAEINPLISEILS